MTRTPIRLALLAALVPLACQAPPPPTSGLLGDLSVFERRDDDTLVHWAVETEDLARYKRLRLERVSAMLPSGSEIALASQLEMRKMFATALRRELDYEFDVGERPAPDTIVVRALIVDVDPGDDEDETPGLASATIELELLDAATGERILAVVSRRRAGGVTTTREQRLEEAQHAFDAWAGELRRWIDLHM